MKHKIMFDLLLKIHENYCWVDIPHTVTVEFESKYEGEELLEEAEKLLAHMMENAQYSIIYWTWIEE